MERSYSIRIWKGSIARPFFFWRLMQNQMVLMMDTLATLGLPFDTNIVEIDKSKMNEIVLFLEDYEICFLFTLQGTFIQPSINTGGDDAD